MLACTNALRCDSEKRGASSKMTKAQKRALKKANKKANKAAKTHAAGRVNLGGR